MGSLSITNSTIDLNQANRAGGGAFNSAGTLTLDGVTLTNNVAISGDGSGGGAFNDQGTMNLLNSTISGNDLCALTYLRPSGSIVNNDFGVNVSGNLCPLLGTDNDDVIRVTNNTITINADSLFYDDETLGRISIEAGAGDDRFEIRSTDADNPITADAGAGDDVVHISSDAPADAGTLNGILGDIDVIGVTHESADQITETATGRRSPTENASVSTTTTIGDMLIISDNSDAGNNAYTLTANTFQRTGPVATGVITYQTTETIDIETGNGNDVVSISSTAANAQATIRSSGGDDEVNIVSTGTDSILRLDTENGADRVKVETTGVGTEYIRVDSLAGNDPISNQTNAISVLNGGEGMDVMLGGSSADALTGGAGVDKLFGRNGNDVLFSEREFGSDPDFVTNGELLDGGGQDDLNPGDVCIQIGLDSVRNCEVLGDGGAEKDVLTWLRAKIVPLDAISFAEDSVQLQPFGPVQFPAPELEATTEPSSLSEAAPSNLIANPNLAQGERSYDVNRDGTITALDAVIVINRMNGSGANEIDAESGLSANDRQREDVDGDGKVSALDALLVINMLNERDQPTAPVAEGESTSVATPSNQWAASVDQAFQTANNWNDDEDVEDAFGIAILF